MKKAITEACVSPWERLTGPLWALRDGDTHGWVLRKSPASMSAASVLGTRRDGERSRGGSWAQQGCGSGQDPSRVASVAPVECWIRHPWALEHGGAKPLPAWSRGVRPWERDRDARGGRQRPARTGAGRENSPELLAGKSVGGRRKAEGTAAATGGTWAGAGAGLGLGLGWGRRSPTAGRHRAALEQGVLGGEVLLEGSWSHSPQSKPSAAGGYHGGVRDGPQGPSWCRGSRRAVSRA